MPRQVLANERYRQAPLLAERRTIEPSEPSRQRGHITLDALEQEVGCGGV
jgi:hypothetical protein